MKLLLDTQVFLWLMAEPEHIPDRVLPAIRDTANDVYLSVASVWEASIKYQIGKLPLPAPPAVLMPDARVRYGMVSLPIDEGTIAQLQTLPSMHRDPFDRILICQALQHGFTLVTTDTMIRRYPVPVL